MTERTGKRRWMPVVLAISLALNLGVVAAMAGAAWRHKGEERGGPRAAKGGAIYMQALPREARRAVRGEMRGIVRTQTDVAPMIAALRQTPFDPLAALGVLEAERDMGLARQTVASEAWLAQITSMSAQERAVYTDRLQELSQQRKARYKERRENSD